MKKRILLLIFVLYSVYTFSQQPKDSGNYTGKDSVALKLIAKLPDDLRKELRGSYEQADDEEKAHLINTLRKYFREGIEPMIANADTNYEKLMFLKARFLELVPPGYRVFIQFDTIYTSNGEEETWDIIAKGLKKDGKPMSKKFMLDGKDHLEILKETLDWDYGTLMHLRKLLKDANCISIDNAEVTTIGFSTSLTGRYFYKIFEHDLSPAEQEKFTDQLHHIFLKRNIGIGLQINLLGYPAKEP